MTLTQTTPFYCSQLSIATDEQIFGTAVANTTVWFLLEYPAAWGAQALEESDLPSAVKDQLFAWQKNIPGSRLQLIKKGSRLAADQINFYVGLSGDSPARLYRFPLDRYEDLLDLAMPAIIAQENDYAQFIDDSRLYLVCTNGKRDQCCAKWGMPLFQALQKQAGDNVWQTTHTGGHRFAPTLLCMPHGLSFGRVEATEARALVDAYQQNAIYQVDRYRGRTCYDPVTQVADAFLREQTGQQALDAFQHLATGQLATDQWEVQFRTTHDNQIHHLQLVSELSTFENPQSCNKTRGEHVRQFRLCQYQMRNS